MVGAALVVSATCSWAGTRVLGTEGEVYSLVRTSLSGAAALELEIAKAGAATVRTRVPGTDDPGAEAFESLFFEAASGRVYAVWQGWVNIHSVIFLAWYDGQWSERVEITRGAFTFKYSPKLVVTREEKAPGASESRTFLHLVFSEEDGTGGLDTVYVPLVLENGRYVGAFESHRLNDSVSGASFDLPVGVSPSLLKSPGLRQGRDGRTVVATFVDGDRGVLASVEIETLPRQLTSVANETRAALVARRPEDLGTAGSLQRAEFAASVAATARAVALAEGFDEGVADTLAVRLRGAVLDEPNSGSQGLTRIAGEARAHIIIVGARIRGGGLAREAAANTLLKASSLSERPDYDLRFSVLAAREVPRTSAEFENTLVASPDGAGAIVSWSDGKRVRYRESTETGWSEIRSLPLSQNLTLEQARAVLIERAENLR